MIAKGLNTRILKLDFMVVGKMPFTRKASQVNLYFRKLTSDRTGCGFKPSEKSAVIPRRKMMRGGPRMAAAAAAKRRKRISEHCRGSFLHPNGSLLSCQR